MKLLFVYPCSPIQLLYLTGIKFIEGFGVDDVNKPHDEMRKS